MSYDALIVGSGPNGLSAGIMLARRGFRTLIVEQAETIGGGCRSAALTESGFIHDICAAVHPLGFSSPIFKELQLEQQGLKWRQPEIPLAHPLDDGRAALLHRSLAATAENLGRDGQAYQELVNPFVNSWPELVSSILGPVLSLPRHPLLMARFAQASLPSVKHLVNRHFYGDAGKALFAGLAVHGLLPLERAPTASFAMVLSCAAHAAGWPLVAGGSQELAHALARTFCKFGGRIESGRPIKNFADLPAARTTLFDLNPGQIAALAGKRFSLSQSQRLRRFRHGPGVFKLDWALNEKIPWRNPDCGRAGTVHLGGTFAEIARSEREVWLGCHPAKPAVILVQPSLFDPSRAPMGKHTAWAYCHVPAGSDFDMHQAVEDQIERFAPGFKETIRQRSIMNPPAMEAHNPNYVGGDITGGVQNLRQTIFRPTVTLRPYNLPRPGWFLCSASSPPGGGVHGMCGFHAARQAIKWLENGR
ncbi:MAG: NAD(P)/FAD-dependent oxidoreductase [Deltaproteobacteria bacterium]|nr:NAD(P)/FAD-dependent oxidoreductase [Deltaproteobacteria bacterium]